MTSPAIASGVGRLDVAYVDGEQYEIDVRGHRVRVDRPVEARGDDKAPTPPGLSGPGGVFVDGQMSQRFF